MIYRMLFSSSLIFVCLLPFKANAAEKDYEKELLEEVVKFKDDKMIMQEFGLLSFPFSSDVKIQVKFYAEAPSEHVISRDMFVGITAMLQTIFFFQIAMDIKQELMPRIKMDDNDLPFDFEELDEPIGNVDMEINIYMSKGGLQMEFVDTKENKTERHTMTWKEMFE
ncbi:MAG: hypothetical protein OXC45_07470 [Gemmatimonadetes bacterium]|nr:hypothetical protein [Gemmatimonadota bacterium]